MKTISEIVKGRPLHALDRNKTVFDAAVLMAEQDIGALPVVDGQRLVGIFSERDIIKRVISQEKNPSATPVHEVMTTKIIVADANESFDSCLSKMKKAHCRHIPIISGDELVGMVSLRDLLQINLDEKEQNLEYLESYIYTIPPGVAKRYQDQ